MNETFENRLRASARAGWGTLLIGVVFLVVQWAIYLLVMSTQPSWLLVLWGNGMSWDTVRTLWFWGAAAFKFCLWLMALVVIWLTLWARQMRNHTGNLR
jgi:hypothetical protein